MIDEFVRHLKDLEYYKGQIEHVEVIQPKEASFGELEKPLPENIQNYLSRKEIDRKSVV